VNLKEHEKYIEIMNNSDMREISIHELAGLSDLKPLRLQDTLRSKKS
jgi:hypothetical protein